MKIYSFLILVQIALSSSAQETRIDSLFKILEKDVEIQQAHSGMVGGDDDTDETFYSLMIASPVDSLLKYMDHPNAAIRCIIFGGLYNKNADEKLLKKIVNAHLNDTAVYRSRGGCVVSSVTVINYMKFFADHLEGERKVIDFKKRLERLKQEPRIILPGLRHRRITKENLSKIESLVHSNDDVKIISFTMVFINDAGFEGLRSESNLVTCSMKERILQLRSGKPIIIDEIKARMPDGYVGTLPSVSFVIE